MSQPGKGKKHPAKGDRAHGDKSASGAAGDQKGAEAAKKPAKTGVAESPKTQSSGTSSISKVQPSSAVGSKPTPTMKPSETKASSSQQKTSGSESHKKKRNKKQAIQKSKTESEKAAQLAKTQLDASTTKHPSEEKQKDSRGAKSPSKPSTVTEPEKTVPGKAASIQTDGSPAQLITKEEPKAKSDHKPLPSEGAVAAVAGAAGAVAAAGLTAAAAESKEDRSIAATPAAAGSKPPDEKSKEDKSIATTPAAAGSKPPDEKSDLDTALDDLIDTLESPKENEPPAPAYTGPEISEDPLSSIYIEELGKRESTIPPKYRKLLESKEADKVVPPPGAVGESQPTMTDDDLADALSSDFTCSAVLPAGEKSVEPKEKKPAEEGDLLQAESLTLVHTSAPPKEKKPKLEEAAISDSALDALVDTLGMPEPEPEEDLSSIVEVEEPKAKERKEKKPGEQDDTIPPEYRLKPVLDKDGKPLLPEPEEKPKPISESDLADEFSKDFASSPPEISEPSKPADVPTKPVAVESSEASKEKITASPAVPSVQSSLPPAVSTKPSVAQPEKIPTEHVVSAAAAPVIQSSAPTATPPSAQVTDEALEALSGSLGTRQLDPEEKKPAVDKMKEKAKQETREKLGEDEETIPPEYRLIEAKDKDGKPLLPVPEEKPKPLSESELLDALSEGFSSPAPASEVPPSAELQKSPGTRKPAVTPTEETISSVSASAVRSSAPQPAATPDQKERDDAADLLADSLGQRKPDPDENKPAVDKIKEKAKSEHRDKLGERDDTIPPDYRHLLDSDEKGKPVKTKSKDGEKPKEQKKPADDSAAIDALSGDFDNIAKLPPSQQPSTKDEKSKDAATSKSGRKDEKKSKSSKKAKEQSSSAKSEKQKKS
uniref:Calpastatin n=1 Tax=Pogona vitticeps TaxID=103695 RepID=A0A6J0TKW8_9SAUR